MTRDEMIRLLVLDRLEHRDDLGRYLHLQRVLENGFRGFRNLSDKELLCEIRALGLESGGSDHFDDGLDDFFDDGVFDSSLFIGHVFGKRSTDSVDKSVHHPVDSLLGDM